jgi:phosphoribosylanthranilate isomerase
MSGIRVKICGVTRVDDAVRAAYLGADAIGLNFWPGSKRVVDVATAREIVDALPPLVMAVGVFVDQAPEDVRRIASEVRLSAVQLHGSESVADCGGHTVPVYKAFRCAPRDDSGGLPWVEEVSLYSGAVTGVLLDAASSGPGGTGRVCDWALAKKVASELPVLLAGGLTPANLAAAIAAVRPWGVDVASGVEASPGVKDPDLMARFIRVAKETAP